MTVERVSRWLEDLGLGRYAPDFAENDVDEDVLPTLDNDDLKELGVASLGHRKRILAALAERREAPPAPPAPRPRESAPIAYVPRHLAQRIIQSRQALEGERKQVTVLFADIKGSMELLAGTDPEYAAGIIDPVVEAMMAAVHRYDGTVNRVHGDGIMALFGAPIAQEDHALRACYAALALRAAMTELSRESRRAVGVDLEVRVGLNSGEVVVRAIKNDLTINYDAMGETAHLASRMEQMAPAGRIRIAHPTYRLVRDFVTVEALGPVPVKGLDEPVEVYELSGASAIRTRIQASAAAGFTPFVGREREMGMLIDALEASADSGGRIVGVVGEPGVGKSRLYYEFTRLPRLQSRSVLTCGSVSHGRASAYLPIAGLLREYFGIGEQEEPRGGNEKVLGRVLTLDEDLRHLVPALLSVLEVPVGDPDWRALDPSERRERIREAVRALLIRESEEQPLVVVLEDLHWFDTESLGVLEALVGSLGATRILMVVNFRPEFVEGWSRAAYTRLRLEPLGAASVESLLDHLLGGAPELEQLKALLVERTEGNPLFIEETVRSMIETGTLVGSTGAYRPASPETVFEVPSSVQSVLAARMDRLEPDTKHLLQCASVIGKDFNFPVLLPLSGLAAATLDAELGVLKEGEFVYEVKLFPEKEYTFKHALTHQVVYGSLVGQRRVALHREVLRLVEAQWDRPTNEQLQQMARHALAGEQWEEAARYGREGGLRLAEQNATRPAAIAFETALEALGHLPYDEKRARTRIELDFRLRDAYFILGDHERIPARLDDARALSERLGDRTRLGWSIMQRAGLDWQAGRLRDALDGAERALEIARECDAPELRALAEYRRGITLCALGRYRESVAALEQALQWLGTEEGRQYFQLGGLPYCFACSFLAWTLAELDELDAALEIGQRAYEHAVDQGQAYTQCVSVFGLTLALFYAGRGEESRPFLERAYELAQSGEARVTVPWLGAYLSQLNAAAGRIDAAREVLEESRGEAGPAHAHTTLQIARALHALDEREAALELLDETEALAVAQHEAATAEWARALRIAILLEAGEQERVSELEACAARAEAEEWWALARFCRERAERVA